MKIATIAEIRGPRMRRVSVVGAGPGTGMVGRAVDSGAGQVAAETVGANVVTSAPLCSCCSRSNHAMATNSFRS